MQVLVQKTNSFTFLKAFCLIVITLLCIPEAKAQEQNTVSVNGTIYSQIDSDPLPGASIVLNNSIRGTESDLDGNFEFENLKVGDKITIHFMGYANKEITISNNTKPLKIYLKEDGYVLDVLQLGAADTGEHYKTKRGFFKNLFNSRK